MDEDHDAWVDRFEHYDAAGVLEKVGRWRKQRGRADEWTYRAPDGRPARIEYDDDGDGKPERAEVLEGRRSSSASRPTPTATAARTAGRPGSAGGS